MTSLLPSRYILHRGALIALGLLIVLLAVGSPNRASAQDQILVSNWQWEPSSELGSFRDYDHAQEFTTGSHGLGATADGDSAEVSGTTAAAGGTGQSRGASTAQVGVSFVIYYDPDAGDAAAARYDQAVALLTGAGISYGEVRGDVRAEVDRLAGVTNSIIPRFFLGDPTAPDWVSEPKGNNGGLRWLKQKVAELGGE